MVLRLIRDLPGEAAFLAPVVSAILRANVAPGSRRQDHTISPAAVSVSSGRKPARRHNGPSQPAPRSVTIARTSLMVARDRHNLVLIYGIVKDDISEFRTKRRRGGRLAPVLSRYLKSRSKRSQQFIAQHSNLHGITGTKQHSSDEIRPTDGKLNYVS